MSFDQKQKPVANGCGSKRDHLFMGNRKNLVLVISFVMVAGLFIAKTGPLALNALTAVVGDQFGNAPASGGYPAAVTIEEAGKVERYRMRLTVSSMGSEHLPEHATVAGAYILKPPAAVVTINYAEDDATQSVTMTSLDGLHYLQEGDMVVQMPDAVFNIQELTWIAPQDATNLAGSFLLIGEEEVNSRTTLHYQGDPKAIPTDGTIDLSRLETATIDVWVDTAENFIVAMELRAFGLDGNPDGVYEMRLDYFDFNDPGIVIETPELTDSLPPQ
jgi:hypothetical protein